MIKSIVLNDKEYVIPGRNLYINDGSDLIKFLRVACMVRRYKRPDVEDFYLAIHLDDSSYYCAKRNGQISEGFKGPLNQIFKFFDYGLVIFEDTSKFNLRELAFSDKPLEIDIFGVSDLAKPDTSVFFNFVQELSVFVGDTLTDYNKVFVPVVDKENSWYIGCMDLDTNAVTPLNQEEDRIKNAAKFICNTLKITDKTETILIENFAKPDFELATHALPINYNDKNLQFIFGGDVINMSELIRYECICSASGEVC